MGVQGIGPAPTAPPLSNYGRRILVSHDWSGKTLPDHEAGQGAWVRRLLALSVGHPLDDETHHPHPEPTPLPRRLC